MSLISDGEENKVFLSQSPTANDECIRNYSRPRVSPLGAWLEDRQHRGPAHGAQRGVDGGLRHDTACGGQRVPVCSPDYWGVGLQRKQERAHDLQSWGESVTW